MSVEQALLSQAQPYMLAAKARALIENEVCKGCCPDISLNPVPIEPPYQPVKNTRELATSMQPIPAEELPWQKKDIARLRVWLSPEQKFDWKYSERFLKQLQMVSKPVGFEITGNKEKINIRILCHQPDIPIVGNCFQGEFENCKLTHENFPHEYAWAVWNTVIFRDYFPSPPYSHLLTCPDELSISSYKTLLSGLVNIPSPAIGIFQVIFQPVDPAHNWHRNVQILLDLEYLIKLTSSVNIPQRYQQQAPSGDLRQMAMDVETKAHNDKPFYAAVLRIGITGKDKNNDN